MHNLSLPAGLSSLVHHVTLNEAGWGDKTIQRLIVAVLWRSGTSLTLLDISEALHRDFKMKLDTGRLKAQIDALCTLETLSKDGDHLRINNGRLEEFQRDFDESEENEKKVKARFVALLDKFCPELEEPDEIWKSFNDHFLFPLIKENGARVYNLISGSAVPVTSSRKLHEFLLKYKEKRRQSLQAAIVSFFDSQNSDLRSYVLRHLNVHFCLEVVSLDKKALTGLARHTSNIPKFEIYVDTNFLFSILGLHDDHSNEAAHSFMNLIGRVSGHVKVKLFALKITKYEALNRLRAERNFLQSLQQITPDLVDFARKNELSRLAQKFIKEFAKSASPLDAKDYFDRYINDLNEERTPKGVEFIDLRINDDDIKREVAQDVEQQLKYEKNHFMKKGKGKKQLQHDVDLWHLVRSKRRMETNPHLDAYFWIVTEDTRYLQFDERQRNSSADEMPVCVSPSVLIQTLQFWIPRDAEFEKSLLDSFRSYFLFQDSDFDTEKITIHILECLDKYKDKSALSPKTISELLNTALRYRIAVHPGGEQQVIIRLLKETLNDKAALIKENKEVRRQVSSILTEAEKLQEELETKKRTTAVLEQKVNEQKSKIEEMQKAFGIEQENRSHLESSLRESEDARQAESKEYEKKVRLQFFINWVVMPILCIVLLGLAAALWRTNVAEQEFWVTATMVWGTLLMALPFLIDKAGARYASIKDWRVFAYFHKWRISYIILGGISFILKSAIGGFIENVTWDSVKQWWESFKNAVSGWMN
jgi:hypothetical protein